MLGIKEQVVRQTFNRKIPAIGYASDVCIPPNWMHFLNV